MPPAAPPRLMGRHRSLWASVASAEPAVFGGAYAAIETFQTDLGTRGYYAPPRGEPGARWGVLRFNARCTRRLPWPSRSAPTAPWRSARPMRL